MDAHNAESARRRLDDAIARRVPRFGPVQVFERSDGFTEVYVDCEHEDLLRRQVRAVLRFHRINGAWGITVSDDLIRSSPEAIHACLGVAMREMAAQSDGSVRE